MAETTTTLPDYPKGITFEQVWAALLKTDRQMKETDRRLKETEQIVQETSRLVKETSQQMGGLNNSFGELAQHLVATNAGIRGQWPWQ